MGRRGAARGSRTAGRGGSRPLALALLGLGLGTASAAGNADVVGAWRLEGTDEGGQPRAAVLYLQERPGGELTGRWNMRAGSIELHEVRYEEGQLTFWFYTDTSQTLVRLFFSAKVEGDTLVGQLKEPHTTGDVKGTRIGVRPADSPAAADDPGGAAPEPPGAR